MHGKNIRHVETLGTQGVAHRAVNAISLGDGGALCLSETKREWGHNPVSAGVRTLKIPMAFRLSLSSQTALSLPLRFTGRTWCSYTMEDTSL